MKIFPLLIVCALFSVSCSSSKNTQVVDALQSAPYQKEPLQIDGSDADWSQAVLPANDKQPFGYRISNDNENLYIQLFTQQENPIQRILRGGLTVYVNSYGVKEEQGSGGISFPTGNRIKKDGQLLNDRPELQADKHIALSNVGDYSLFGFKQVKTPSNYDYGKPNPEEIQVAVGLNAANALVYEAKIPLRAFMNTAQIITPSRKTIAVEFVMEDIPGEQAARNRGGGVSIGGGLGFGSFGTGGGLGLSIGTDALGNIGRKKPKQIKQWTTITLSKEPSGK